MNGKYHNLAEPLSRIGEAERWIIVHLLLWKSMARDTNAVHEECLTLGERVAD